MLSSVRVTKCLPDLDECLAWLPVDVAATAVVQIAQRGGEVRSKDHRDGDRDVPVYHVVNNNRTTTWSDLLSWMRNAAAPFEIVPPREWVDRLERLRGEGARHPARKLLGLWKGAVCSFLEPETDRQPTHFFSREREG